MKSANPFPSIADQQEELIRRLTAALDEALERAVTAEKDSERLLDHAGELHEENVNLKRQRCKLWLSLIGTWLFGLFFTVLR
jgi:hypothetical protein